MVHCLSIQYVNGCATRLAKSKQPLSHSATLPEWLDQPRSHSATQPLSQSGWTSHSATQPLWVTEWHSYQSVWVAEWLSGCSSHSATQPLWQSGWTSHSATQPLWVTEWLSGWSSLVQPLSHSATLPERLDQPLSHSATLSLSGWVAAPATLAERGAPSHSGRMSQWVNSWCSLANGDEAVLPRPNFS